MHLISLYPINFPFPPTILTMATSLKPVSAIIIGAGFSGIAAGARLKQKLGLEDYEIYERSPEYGGTWYANQYPGCAVDIPAILYSLSFYRPRNFNSMFPSQPEVLEYMRDVAQAFDVDRHVKCNISWEAAEWQEKSGTWKVTLKNTKTGEMMVQHSKLLISCIGGLVKPNQCTVPGIENFKGKIVHTAVWKDTPTENKNVVVIGNGCSATQVVSAIASKTKNLYQFQRTPQFFFLRPQFQFPWVFRLALKYIPGFYMLCRVLIFNYIESSFPQFTADEQGERARTKASRSSTAYVEKKAPKEYWPLLKPSYMVGCKRKIYDPNYLVQLHRPNVHLTDDPIIEATETEIITKSGDHYPADVIVVANGFDTIFDLNVTGKGGITIKDHWDSVGGPQTYNTISVANFPNFFMIFGPNAASGHTTVLYGIENSINLMMRVAGPVLRNQQASVDVTLEAEQTYNKEAQAVLKRRVWEDCTNFYNNGKGQKNFSLYPWNSYRMWVKTRFPDMSAWIYSKV